MATNGRLHIIGMQGGTKGQLNIGTLMGKRGSVVSNSLRARPVEEKAAICARVVSSVWPMIESGAIVLPTATTFPFTEAAAAHARLESGDHLGKIILTA